MRITSALSSTPPESKARRGSGRASKAEHSRDRRQPHQQEKGQRLSACGVADLGPAQLTLYRLRHADTRNISEELCRCLSHVTLRKVTVIQLGLVSLEILTAGQSGLLTSWGTKMIVADRSTHKSPRSTRKKERQRREKVSTRPLMSDEAQG